MSPAYKKGPLRWLLTLTPGEAHAPPAVAALLAPSLRSGRALERVGLAIAAAIADVPDQPESVDAQLTVLGYGMSAANAARFLVRAGHVRAAESQVRAILEAFAVIECLHGDTARAREWRRAATRKERDAFSFGRLLPCAPVAAKLRPLWDSCGEYIHANSSALPAHSRRRSVFGYDIPVGPMFEAVPMVTMLTLADSVLYQMLDWAVVHLTAVPETRRLRARLDRAGENVMRTGAAASSAAHLLERSLTSEGLSVHEQRRAVAFVARKARTAGQKHAAQWIVRRAKLPR